MQRSSSSELLSAQAPRRPWRAALLLLLAAGSCVAPSAPQVADSSASPDSPPAVVESRELVVSEVAWKERLEQPYVYLEHVGDYRRLGEAMRGLLERVRLAELDVSGAPFALFYDDPASVPADRLRARVCVPVRAGASAAAGLQADLLPRALVVYAEVGGAYPELPRAYPALFAFLRDHGWKPAGPLREIYLVDPGSVADWRELQSEIQVPWTRG